MVYNPTTDFIGLWRNAGGSVSKLEMPGVDYLIAALARAGIITVSVSGTAPAANQATTAWLHTAVPDWSAEGVFNLWDATAGAYVAATPALFFAFLEACAGVSGVSWWTTTGGAPANTVGHDGDYAIRTDGIGGIYGPKTLGAWPASPLPGTTNTIESSALDNTFGVTLGSIIYRDATLWEALPPGAAQSVLTLIAGIPAWEDLSSLLDTVFGSAQGSVLYRGAGAWNDLPPSTDNYVLTTHGADADPSWTPKISEFPSGTTIVFNQSNAPPGWTKLVGLSDYGLRVVSGNVGSQGGTSFSAVFSQTQVAGANLTIAQMPQHDHPYNQTAVVGGGGGFAASGGAYSTVAVPSNTGQMGNGAAHTHAVSLQLAYIDVILAKKD